MKTTLAVQTVNGNFEVIKLENGIAKEIIAGEKSELTQWQAEQIVKVQSIKYS